MTFTLTNSSSATESLYSDIDNNIKKYDKIVKIYDIIFLNIIRWCNLND